MRSQAVTIPKQSSKQNPRQNSRQILENSVVVFSQNYFPLCQVNIKRAIILLINNKAEPLKLTAEVGWKIYSPSLVLYVPKHIRLKISGRERTWKVPPVNRREVLRRDHYTCQYCGSRKHLTLDHVLPRSKGGLHVWDNIVTACEKCNSRKGDKTLKEIGMKLRTKPLAPIHPTILFAEQFWNNVQVDLE
ncbi:MAG: HNH endonuclease [Cyanobacteria bacterium P01_A01_bin.84]